MQIIPSVEHNSPCFCSLEKGLWLHEVLQSMLGSFVQSAKGKEERLYLCADGGGKKVRCHDLSNCGDVYETQLLCDFSPHCPVPLQNHCIL